MSNIFFSIQYNQLMCILVRQYCNTLWTAYGGQKAFACEGQGPDLRLGI